MPNSNFTAGTSPVVIPGSAQGDWQPIRLGVGTSNSAAELLYPASVTNATSISRTFSTVGPLRFLARIRVGTAATTFTTDPVIRFVGVDANGVPTRLDATAATSAGVTFDIASTSAMRDATYYYSDPVQAGYDVLGDKTVYALVQTAGSYTDGTDAQQIDVLIKPLAP